MQRIVEAEDEEFEEEYINDQDPSILHFLLVSGENVRLSHAPLLVMCNKRLTFGLKYPQILWHGMSLTWRWL
jgi:hypothetical protein